MDSDSYCKFHTPYYSYLNLYETVISMRKKIFAIIIMCLTVLVLAECHKISRTFYVDILNVYLHIEETKDSMYRIHISKSRDNLGEDYIDVVYKFSEMPSITLSFPIGYSNDIHIIDRQHGEVKSYFSKNFNIVYPEVADNGFIELGKYQKWCDSVMYDIPSVSVQIDLYLKTLSVWNEYGEYIGSITPVK